MAFYCPDGALQLRLEQVIDGLAADGRPQLRRDLSVTWLIYERPSGGSPCAVPAGRGSSPATRPAW